MRADGLHLDPTATRLRRQDFDRLGPMWARKDSSLGQLVHNVVSGHNIPCRYRHKYIRLLYLFSIYPTLVLPHLANHAWLFYNASSLHPAPFIVDVGTCS